jgi:hypothetical protein
MTQTTLDGTELSRVKELERLIEHYRVQYKETRQKIRDYKKELRSLNQKLREK